MHLVPRLIDKAEAAETFRASHEFYVCDVHATSGPRLLMCGIQIKFRNLKLLCTVL